MSFSSDVKSELCQIKSHKSCCLIAECAGMLLFSRSLTYEKISFYTDFDFVAEHLCYLMKKRLKIVAEHIITDGGVNKVEVMPRRDRETIVARMKNGDKPADGLIQNECCLAAFLRGVFLSCGSLTDPNKEYRLEFVCPSHLMAQYLYGFLSGIIENPKIAERDGVYYVYYKHSEAVEDMLTLVGAANAALEVMEIKVEKDMRNKLNRVNNFENANLAKTVNAAVDQTEAIEKIIAAGKLDSLSEALRETAVLRKDNPDSSLSQLCEISGCSRSGLNHRLKRLIEIANEL